MIVKPETKTRSKNDSPGRIESKKDKLRVNLMIKFCYLIRVEKHDKAIPHAPYSACALRQRQMQRERRL
jgi:hypothetical protein